MATGDTLFIFEPQHNIPPASNYATFGTITAQTGERLILEFTNGTADESAMFAAAWPSHYDGGGINVVAHYSTDGTLAREVRWMVSVETLDDNDDTDAGSIDFGTATNIDDTPAATVAANKMYITAAGAISHANCDSPTAGDGFRLKITRDEDHNGGSGENTDTAQLHRIVVTEQ